MRTTFLPGKPSVWFKIGACSCLLLLISLSLLSFTAHRLAVDFLKELGITQQTADERISTTMLEGSFNTYGIKKTKAIPAPIRGIVAKEAFTYAKKYVNTSAYLKKYEELRASKKPVFEPIKTVEEMIQENTALYRKSVQEAEANLKKADASMKQVFENVLAEVKKQQLEAENPNNKRYVNYRRNYESTVKVNQENYDRQVAAWEQQYPANHLLFIKKRLEQFMLDTDGVDFAATTTLKNGKQIFDNPQYERKSNRWKMAFRSGKEVVETSRIFVQQWLSEIN